MSAVKLSISLERATADKLKRRARESGKATSRYIATLIEEDDRRAQDELAAEGYRLLADDSRELEETAWRIAAEGSPEWEEPDADETQAPKRGCLLGDFEPVRGVEHCLTAPCSGWTPPSATSSASSTPGTPPAAVWHVPPDRSLGPCP